MTKERAQYILDNPYDRFFLRFAFRHDYLSTGAICADGITKEEDEYIKMIWSMMDGSKSYHDAVVSIAEGL